MYTGFVLQTARLGIKNIFLHKLRSFLTTLGIICGVGAVICMLSISEGGSEAQMALIRMLGTQNVIVKSVKPEGVRSVSENRSELLEYGITSEDLSMIQHTIPGVARVVPMREVGFEVSYKASVFPATVVGTEPAFFETIHVELARGRPICDIDQRDQAKVCVIGDEVRRQLFSLDDPIGRSLTVSAGRTLVPFEVVGVLKRVEQAGEPARGLGERNLNTDVLIPFATADARYSDMQSKRTSGTHEHTRCEYSDLYVQADSLENVVAVSEMVRQVLQRNHRDKLDYQVRVPLETLRIAETQKRNRQIMLGSIAGISLLVGGIGIMNIMLATVTERTREIGIRRALGAKRRHITLQFLMESLILSTAGGLIGILTGATGAHLITRWAGWPTLIHEWTIFVSLGLALAVGVFFGIYPAAAAARLDPIEALRHA